MATASCGKRGRVTEEEEECEEVGNNEEMGGSDGMAEDDVCGKTIAVEE